MKWIWTFLAAAALALGGVIGWRATDDDPVKRNTPAGTFQLPTVSEDFGKSP